METNYEKQKQKSSTMLERTITGKKTSTSIENTYNKKSDKLVKKKDGKKDS